MDKRTIRTPNEIFDKGNYCEMVLYNRKCQEIARTLFSKRHLYRVKKHKWGVGRKGYCYGTINKIMYPLHHFIYGKPPKGLVTDHINHNRLDNRDENLRFVTVSVNNRNISYKRRCSIKGYFQRKSTKRWIAQIQINSKIYWLGTFKNEEDAINARKQAEIKYSLN